MRICWWPPETIVTSPADIGTPKLIMKTKDWAAAPNGGKSFETKADSIRANCRKNVPEIHSTTTLWTISLGINLGMLWKCSSLENPPAPVGAEAWSSGWHSCIASCSFCWGAEGKTFALDWRSFKGVKGARIALTLEKKIAQRVPQLDSNCVLGMAEKPFKSGFTVHGGGTSGAPKATTALRVVITRWAMRVFESHSVEPWNSPPHPSFWQCPTNTQTPFNKWGGINRKQSKHLLLQAAEDQHPTVGNIATIQPIRPRLLLGEFLFVLPFQLNLSQIDFILSCGRWESKHISSTPTRTITNYHELTIQILNMLLQTQATLSIHQHPST